jgi:hypothetical protein
MRNITILSLPMMALAFAGFACANVIITNTVDGTAVVGGSYNGDYAYTYTASLDGAQFFTGGAPSEDYCLSNISGFANGSASMTATPGFALYSGLTGGCSSAQVATTAGLNVSNTGAWIEVVYTGGTTIASGSSLPSISFDSTNAGSLSVSIAAGGRAYNVSGQTANQADLVGPSVNAPEPSTITLLGSALLGLGFFGRRRAKKA